MTTITRPPAPGADGLCLCDGKPHEYEGLTIDLSGCELDTLDEALGVSWGCAATFRNCVFRGAGKLVLCGSGDEHKAEAEYGKTVIFENCVFENFGRRGPEVQAGMHVLLKDCVIRNWGQPDRWDTRCFGAWAHHEATLLAVNCRFEQDSFWKGWGCMWRDLVGHIGQAVNDEGVLALFKPRTWLPGVCRGLTAGPGGRVEAYDCTKNRWWILLENNKRVHTSS